MTDLRRELEKVLDNLTKENGDEVFIGKGYSFRDEFITAIENLIKDRYMAKHINWKVRKDKMV